MPGSIATSRVFPFFPEDWHSIAIGDALGVTEGPNRTVGRAAVTRVVPVAVLVGRSSS